MAGITNEPEIIYSGGAQNVMPLDYGNLSITGTLVKTMLGPVNIENNLSIGGSATLYTNTFQITYTGSGSGTLSMGPLTGLQLGNPALGTSVTFPSNYSRAGINLNATSTVTYQTNAVQPVSTEPVYGNLTISQAFVKTLTGGQPTADVVGNLTINSGTLNLGTSAATINVGGNVIATGGITVVEQSI
jgi:hypothetical protein